MLVVKCAPLKLGLNHISLPLGAEVLCVGGNQVFYKCSEIPPALENRTFLLVVTDQLMAEASAGTYWRYIDTYAIFHVFELVPAHASKPTGDQLVGEDR